MTPANLNQIIENDLLRKRLAKVLALRCFRNTYLEDLYAGSVPQTETGDYSDVRVVDADRDIPWSQLSRFSDREMKTLMIEVVDHCYDFLTTLYTDSAGDALIATLKASDPVPEWNHPVGWKARQKGLALDGRPHAGI